MQQEWEFLSNVVRIKSLKICGLSQGPLLLIPIEKSYFLYQRQSIVIYNPKLTSSILSFTFHIPGSRTRGNGSVTVLIRGPILEVRQNKYDPLILKMEPEDEIDQIHSMIEELTGYPNWQQRLIFGGRQLASDVTLSDIGIESGSFAYLFLQCKGD